MPQERAGEVVVHAVAVEVLSPPPADVAAIPLAVLRLQPVRAVSLVRSCSGPPAPEPASENR